MTEIKIDKDLLDKYRLIIAGIKIEVLEEDIDKIINELAKDATLLNVAHVMDTLRKVQKELAEARDVLRE